MKMLKNSWKVLLTTTLLWKKNTGRFLREAGLALDRRGSQLTHDIAYL